MNIVKKGDPKEFLKAIDSWVEFVKMAMNFEIVQVTFVG